MGASKPARGGWLHDGRRRYDWQELSGSVVGLAALCRLTRVAGVSAAGGVSMVEPVGALAGFGSSASAVSGGSAAWQVFDSEGEPTKQNGRVKGGIAVWSLPAVVANGSRFLLFH